jgi:hypothetical protein
MIGNNIVSYNQDKKALPSYNTHYSINGLLLIFSATLNNGTAISLGNIFLPRP